MRITGPQSPSTGKVGKKAATKSGGAGFASHLSAQEDAGATGLQGTAPLGGVGNLLAVDYDEPSTGGQQQGEDRAEMLLDALENIQRALLIGGMPTSRLQNIAKMIGTQRPEFENPQLNALLDDVELRVQVELAKHTL